MLRFLFLILLFPYSIQSQQNICYDSIEYKRICPLIDSMINEGDTWFFENRPLHVVLNKDKNCILKRYAICFDCFFNSGLEVNKKVPPSLPRISWGVPDQDTFMIAERNRRKKLGEDREKIHTRYKLFARIKKHYENFILPVYFDKKNHNDIVHIIINYGNFNYPLLVQKVLLGELKHINETKYYRDIR